MREGDTLEQLQALLIQARTNYLELQKRFIQLDNWRIRHEQECEKARRDYQP